METSLKRPAKLNYRWCIIGDPRSFGNPQEDPPLAAWDQGILREVVEGDFYGLRALAAEGGVVRTALEVGAHIGGFTAFVKSLWPEARVLCVEPDQHTFLLLEQNVGSLAGVQLVQGVLVGDATRQVKFRSLRLDARTPRNTGCGRVAGPGEPYDAVVPATTLSGLLREYGIERVDLLKLDCEGMEAALLAEARGSGTLAAVQWVRGEWHGAETAERVRAALDKGHVSSFTTSASDSRFGSFIAHDPQYSS